MIPTEAPKNIKNILVTGRCISCDFEAFSSVRINATCMAIGEFAGNAAKELIHSGDIRLLDVAGTVRKMKQMQYRYFQSLPEKSNLPEPWYNGNDN